MNLPVGIRVIVFVACHTVGTAMATEIVGTVGRVVDGDTLYVCDERLCEKIRICGINAPELSDRRGKEARAALASIVNDKHVRCAPVGEGTVCDGRSKRISRDRIVAQCFIGKYDVAEMLVERGYACDWVKFSGGHYSRGNQDNRCH
jgi:endonuclease YncB( thermonuclease family)